MKKLVIDSPDKVHWLDCRTAIINKDDKKYIYDITQLDITNPEARPYDYIWDMYYDEFEDADDSTYINMIKSKSLKVRFVQFIKELLKSFRIPLTFGCKCYIIMP